MSQFGDQMVKDTMNRQAHLLLLVSFGSLTGVLFGCGEDSGGAREVTVTDSAGVRIVQNGYVDLDEVGWRVGDEPAFRVGWDPSDRQFGGIVGGFLTDAGEAVVVDGRPYRMIALSPDGEVLQEFGREGQGPGELGWVGHSSPLEDDSIFLFDGGNMRFYVFRAGELAREVNLARYSQRPIVQTNPIGHGSDGRVVFAEERVAAERYEHEWGKADVFTISRDGARWDTIAAWDVPPDENLEWEGSINPGGYVGVSGDWVLTARGDRPEVRWFDLDGVLKQIARWRNEPPIVTERFIQDREQWLLDRGMNTVQARQAVSDVEGPLPYLSGRNGNWSSGAIRGDAEGNVWLRDTRSVYNEAGRFFVISSEGAWAGMVELPARARILDIRRDQLLVVERNGLDVDAIALYRLVKDLNTGSTN